MKKPVQSPFKIILLALVTVVIFLGGNLTYDLYLSDRFESMDVFTTSKEAHYGYIIPKVTDGFSEEPIEGATIVIPEIDQSFVTGADGRTSKIRVPVDPDGRFKSIMPKSWGEITLIAYKEGYIDYVLFYTHVWENQTREGPEILLFPQDEKKGVEPFAIVEGPNRLWVKELVKKYKR